MFTLAVDICYISLTNSWYCVWLHKSANMHPLPRYSLKAGQRKWWELQVGFVLSIAESANTSRDPSQLELCCWLVVIPWTLPWGWLGGWRMCVCVCVCGGGGVVVIPDWTFLTKIELRSIQNMQTWKWILHSGAAPGLYVWFTHCV